MAKISVIIPTKQRVPKLLNKLFENLNSDSAVGEIIVLDNSGVGFAEDICAKYSKLRLVVNPKNTFLNHSINQGLELVTNEYWAVVDETLVVSDTFCSKALACLNPTMGIVGLESGTVVNITSKEIDYINFEPQELSLEQIEKINNESFQLAIFGHKSSFYKIPAKLKEFFGAEYLFRINQQNKKQNYTISDGKVYRVVYPCPKARAMELEKLVKSDLRHFNQIFFYKPFERIFSIKLSEDKTHRIINFLGIKYKTKLGKLFPEGAKDLRYVSDKLPVTYQHQTATVFVMYSANGRVEQSVVEYLKELKQYSDYVVVVGDCPIFEEELDKIRPYADSYVFKRHGEYDFGSYKRGYLILEKLGILEKVGYLVFANDSVKFLGGSLQNFFEKMRENNFYGLTLNYYGFSKELVAGDFAPHLQSYLLTFSSKIFRAKFFKEFLKKVRKEKKKEQIIYKYEMGLSRLIVDNGFGLNSYYEPLDREQCVNPCSYYLNKDSNFAGERLFEKRYLHKSSMKFQYTKEGV